MREAKRRIDLLRTTPFAFDAIPELQEIGIDGRQILHGQYRIIYLVKRGRVRIVRILRAARRLTAGLLGIEPPEPEG